MPDHIQSQKWPQCTTRVPKAFRVLDCLIHQNNAGAKSLAWISSDYLESLLLPERTKRLEAIGWNSGYEAPGMKGKGDAKWRRIRQKNLTSVRSSYILWILKRTLNYDGYVAITEGQAFDLSLKGLCHGSPVHFVNFANLILALNRYGT